MMQRLLSFFGPPPGGNDPGTVRLRRLSLVLNVHIVIALSVGVFYPKDPEAPAAAAAVALAAREGSERLAAEALFDKLTPKSERTGVGLALVKRIVEVHGPA